MRTTLLLLLISLSSCVCYDNGYNRTFDVIPPQISYRQSYPCFNRPYGYIPYCFNSYPQTRYDIRLSW